MGGQPTKNFRSLDASIGPQRAFRCLAFIPKLEDPPHVRDFLLGKPFKPAQPNLGYVGTLTKQTFLNFRVLLNFTQKFTGKRPILTKFGHGKKPCAPKILKKFSCILQNIRIGEVLRSYRIFAS